VRRTVLFVTCLVLIGTSVSAVGSRNPLLLPKEVVAAIVRDAYEGSLPAGLNVGTWDHVVFDLNQDRRPDYVIAQKDPDYCGSGGCSLLIVVSSPSGYRSVYSGGNFFMECWSSKNSTNGFADLVFKGKANGEDYLHLLRYDGKEYQEIKFH
jgi:hypothetical protein